MAKVQMVAAAPYKGHAVGDSFVTSLKNSRSLVSDGIATIFGEPAKVASKAPAKVAAKKAPAKKAAAKKTGYSTRALKAR